MNAQRTRSILIQVTTLLVLAAGIGYFAVNATKNMDALGLTTGLSFMNQIAGFDISFSVIPYDRTSSTYGDVLLVGITNTLTVSAIAIVFATILGTTIGIFQLLGNWPLTKLCRTYIETARNVPLLLQLVFWYTGVLATLPSLRNSLSISDSVFLNVRGLFIPWPDQAEGFNALMVAISLGVVIWVILARRARLIREATGKAPRSTLWAVCILIVLIALAAVFFGNPFTWAFPVLKGFNFSGGSWLPPELVALLLGLSLYTAAFIAELVRGGIQAISAGQREAALAIGLSNWQTMKLVMIPQAMRIIVPPLTSQYLNIVKNSSLAVAIAYPDIVSVFTGTTLNQTGRAIEIVAITMGFYLCISLLISAFMNWYNKRVALVERM